MVFGRPRQEYLARIMDRPVQVISEIVAAKKQITSETALGLAGAFGTSAEMWLEMEAAYRLKMARKTGAMADVERRGRIYSAVPVKGQRRGTKYRAVEQINPPAS
jgi:HTH-type transcriptional regulator/antitoxin HigA